MKAFLAVLALALVAVLVVNRQPDGGEGDGDPGTGSDSGGSAGARCTVFADAPVVERTGRVVGTGRYRCRKPDGGVDAIVYLQRSGTDGWANVDRQPMAATGADATGERPPEDRVVRVNAPCAPGSYRTFVGGTVSDRDRGFFVAAGSEPVTLDCVGPEPV